MGSFGSLLTTNIAYIRYTVGMNFEYDKNKNDINSLKHGIDFIEAQKLWLDENLIEVELNFPNETRWMCVAKINSKHYSAFITYRDNAIRIISVRRSRKKEIFNYENR